MNLNECKVGAKVFFGRAGGQRTLGEITQVNRTTAKVKQLESRGSVKDHRIGTIWKVPFNLMSLAAVGVTPKATLQPLVTFPAFKTVNPFKVGDTVSFDARGTTIIGTVKSVNIKTVSVDTPQGKWRVSPGMLRPATGSAPVAKMKRPDQEILMDIASVYAQFSPENLMCDGELSRTQVARRAAGLNAKRKALFQEIGRRVSEDEAWNAIGI